MNLTLHIWRQKDPKDKGRFATYRMTSANEHMSFLEMLDVLNQELIAKGEEPVAFEHDCREGICGSCGMVVDGAPHGGHRGTTVCQLHMRHFKDGDEIIVEPWRAAAFPVAKDLVVDRSAFDRIMAAGGFISVRTGSAAEANAIPISKPAADLAMDYAECIGCGACVAACPNGAAMRRAVRRALLEHKLLGYPICEWRDGRVVWIAPEDIDVPAPRRCIRAITGGPRSRDRMARRSSK